ncbi:MAG: hypothetical protein K2L55_02595 [Muribaculaceae bacterium]|nr:hypothetical protein [Muribaculaceae bacterium]MDE6345539.1 hypothetical protein [Muribaculaceae bacterium]
MALTEQQVNMVMSQSVEQIKKYISQGLISFPDDLAKYKDSPKYKAIEKELTSMPSHEASARWKEIEAMDNSDLATLTAALGSFISVYGSYPGNQTLVDSARLRLSSLTADVERNDWEKIDDRSITALLTHRRKYQSTSHETDIDNRVWELTDKDNAMQVNRYIQEFPNGLHRVEAQDMLGAQELWKGVSTDADLVTLSDYIQEESLSPFIPMATEMLQELKRAEIAKMLENPGTYKVDFLKLLIDEKIFSQQELIAHGVCTAGTFDMLYNSPELPSIEQTENSNPQIAKGATDVFLFGIPSSGKTCVLMGLLGSKNFVYDNAASGPGGTYADNLSIYRRHNKAPGRTYGNFVAQIQGMVYRDNSETVYPINLIEMSGEEFAMKIALNPENLVDFEDMGTGATKILTSDNRKIIFIVIDPTADGLIKLSSTLKDGSPVTRIVEQDIIITKMVNMLIKNPKVLKNTNAIHFILTKSDTLGSRDERDKIAVERIRQLYGKTIMTLRDICKTYSINKSTDYQPSLFTFSLGEFHVGDLFEYDSYDADKLMNIVTSMAQGRKEKGFFNSIQKKMS